LRLRQDEALLGPSKAIATHRNLSDLLHHLAGHRRDLFDFHNLGIMLHDASRNVLCLHTLETSEPAMWRFPSEIPIAGDASEPTFKDAQMVLWVNSVVSLMMAALYLERRRRGTDANIANIGHIHSPQLRRGGSD
jgi:hypothetical protein